MLSVSFIGGIKKSLVSQTLKKRSLAALRWTWENCKTYVKGEKGWAALSPTFGQTCQLTFCVTAIKVVLQTNGHKQVKMECKNYAYNQYQHKNFIH